MRLPGVCAACRGKEPQLLLILERRELGATTYHAMPPAEIDDVADLMRDSGGGVEVLTYVALRWERVR